MFDINEYLLRKTQKNLLQKVLRLGGENNVVARMGRKT